MLSGSPGINTIGWTVESSVWEILINTILIAAIDVNNDLYEQLYSDYF